MARGSLLGPLLLLTALLGVTNTVSCYHTLTTIDHTVSAEEDRKKREEDHWFKGFPIDQIRHSVEGYGQDLAYFIDQKITSYYQRN
jgi:hypothetical protein